MDVCPVCGSMAVGSCQCLQGDRFCMLGHNWFRCPAHSNVIVIVRSGENSHAKGNEDGCKCHLHDGSAVESFNKKGRLIVLTLIFCFFMILFFC